MQRWRNPPIRLLREAKRMRCFDLIQMVMSSDATARLKMAEPAELSHFEPSQAIKLAHNQNGLGSAHELAQPG